jgi:hypothetical protein
MPSDEDIDDVREAYIEGELTEDEFEAALEDVIEHEGDDEPKASTYGDERGSRLDIEVQYEDENGDISTIKQISFDIESESGDLIEVERDGIDIDWRLR